MKKFLTTLTICLLGVCLLFTGCGAPVSLPTGEAKNGAGYGNVTYDEYIYFANSSVIVSDLTAGDNTGNLAETAIYRTKLTNGKVEYDEDGYALNTEKVADKLGAFNSSFMYAKGDMIYFASPNTHRSTTNETLFDRNTYYSMRADGSNLRELYSTLDAVTLQAVLTIDDTDYLVIYEGERVVRLDLTNGGSLVLAEDVTSAVFAEEYENENDGFVYYTADRTDEEGATEGVTGNILRKVSMVSGEMTQMRREVGETITLYSYTDGVLYYTRNTTEQTTFYFANTLAAGFEASEAQLTQAITEGITNFMPLGKDEYGQNKPVIYEYSSRLVMSNFGSTIPEVLVDEDVTVQLISGDYIYFTTTSGIYRISYIDKVRQTVVEMSNFREANLSITADGKYLIFYAQVADNTTDTYYAHIINLFDVEQGVETEARPLGAIAEADKPEEEEEE